MRLSVIIVNYNVRHFLEQCLISVRAAIRNIDAEIFVVDNNSVDGSQQMLRDRFPDVKLIENKENLGFSAGNNLALGIATGEYILLLNPDTVVEETTFQKCLEFMDAHPDAGALGVKMIDGEGRYLPESKRGLPTPWVAFYKICGLSRLFPRSKVFGKYHLGYLDKEENHVVDVLSGAYMFMRKACLDSIGLLDESFFMYGEDIDLSYRVMLGGYRNYYFAGTKIIHYKGESTKKGSLNYVKVFYNAMIIFANKHFSKGNASFYTFVIRFAIYLRAFMAVGSRIARRVALPVAEGLLVWAATIAIKEYWEYIHKIQKDKIPYPREFDYIAAPIYAFVFISFLWIAGGYKWPYRAKPIQMAAIFGFVAIATVSFVFPSINFSRMIVGLSSIAMTVIALINRNIWNYWRTGSLFLGEQAKRRVVIVGNDGETARIVKLIRSELDYPVEIEGTVRISDDRPDLREDCLGTLRQLGEVVHIYKIDEVIFANKDFDTEEILNAMSALHLPSLRYKIVPPDADYLVGPQVIHDTLRAEGGLLNLSQKEFRLKKQMVDVFGSLALLLIFPLTFFVYRRPMAAFQNLWKVLNGKLHLVGYIEANPTGLPKLKPGLLDMRNRTLTRANASEEHSRGLDRHYARTYSPGLDLEILAKGIREIG
jgi:O-antigen biosynthesis protein